MNPPILPISVCALLAFAACDRAKAPIDEGGPPADIPPIGGDVAAADAPSLPDTPAPDIRGPGPDTASPDLDSVGPGPDTPMTEDVQWPPVCCDQDVDCPGDLICVGYGDVVLGQCRPPGCYAPPWDACPEHYACIGAITCTCDDDCLSKKGHCAPQDAGCCGPAIAVDCPEGTQCVPEGPSGFGTCAPTPQKEDNCWSDLDCAPWQSCEDAQLCPCDADCGSINSFGYCMDTDLQECIAKHSGCGCEEGCVDGFWAVAYYPEGEGPFPPEFWPSQEILDASVAWYECSICTCEERWHVKVDGVWIDDLEEHVDGFCEFLLEYQESCGDCLESWEGGCC